MKQYFILLNIKIISYKCVKLLKRHAYWDTYFILFFIVNYLKSLKNYNFINSAFIKLPVQFPS